MHVVDHDVDVHVHDEFASDAVVHEVDAHVVVTHDVTGIPGMLLHDDLEDLDVDLSVV